ncbi:MAG: 5-(carboxyamino)imidazole ribonucleotide synthase [Streptosporangiales bacterium]|nr:5-(carboxyamino)imidazole ribonucleotide synthase [Streptosporangiales bacterium]MBO0891930.1 5-(carboxyamino)imidazole ribonucleotide synthase [Acidothermales bacterium]
MRTPEGFPVVGMVGAGQLARMTHAAAIPLGIGFRVLAADPTDGAALVCGDVQVGQHTSLDDLRSFAAGCDVVTFDHEHVPGEHLRALAAEGHAVGPGADALRHTQDKLAMRERLSALDVPCPAYAAAEPSTAVKQVRAFADEHGWPVVAKAVSGGYDGKGVWMLDGPDALGGLPPVPLLLEEHVGFRRELAALVARSPHGQAAAYPIVETVQRDGICVEVLAPAPDLDEDHALEAQRLALRVAGELGVVGLLAVELFETDDGVVVNELAMRPHNSGHWTIEGARTSQFEQHLRAVLDLPLGSPAPVAPVTVMANLLGGRDANVYDRYVHVMAKDPAVKVHLYGKQVRPGRKIGHVTAIGDDPAEVRERARDACDYLRGDS